MEKSETTYREFPPQFPLGGIRKLLLGHPLRTSFHRHTRLGFWLGLPILAVDALSSVAYATEEILIALSTVGTALIPFALPIALVIVFLLTILVLSLIHI